MRALADNQKDNHMTLYDIFVIYLICSLLIKVNRYFKSTATVREWTIWT